jgi:hypothetical protein
MPNWSRSCHMTKSSSINTPLYAHTNVDDYDAQFLNNSGTLQIYILVVFSFSIGSNKVSSTQTMVKRTSPRLGDDYLRSSTKKLVVAQNLPWWDFRPPIWHQHTWVPMQPLVTRPSNDKASWCSTTPVPRHLLCGYCVGNHQIVRWLLRVLSNVNSVEASPFLCGHSVWSHWDVQWLLSPTLNGVDSSNLF